MSRYRPAKGEELGKCQYMNESTKCECPTCGGKGVITMVIWKGRPNAVEVRKPCLDCANSGKVEYKDWVKMTGRDQ